MRWMHCPTLEMMFSFSEEDNIAALQAGHSTAMEEHIYGVSNGYMGWLPENLIEPYAKVSTEWQIFMGVPKGGKEINLFDFPNKSV